MSKDLRGSPIVGAEAQMMETGSNLWALEQQHGQFWGVDIHRGRHERNIMYRAHTVNVDVRCTDSYTRA
jgi:hypothetical protein